ncbi:hypothetical protein ELI25_34190 [Rhizobium ruizarguesonis]|nr:hypothetical protein ELI25_34190 [Rhizobium ruizarguesonis]TAZ50584.1 hypothetical protein ELH76_05050 [Rhizobium ruizarguesonis]
MHYAAVRCCGLHFIVEICCDRARLGRGASGRAGLRASHRKNVDRWPRYSENVTFQLWRNFNFAAAKLRS